MPAGAIPFPFGICRICKDRATGVHYGIATCEGCKGFFKRSITRGDKYKCFFGGDCDLTPKNRNRCKSCRFKRCLDVGMSVEAVRMGRIPKVEKEKALEVFHQGGSDFKNLEIEVEMTGTGTYDFKISSKEGDAKYTNQTALPDIESERSIQQEPSWNQTRISQSVPNKFESDTQKILNEGNNNHSLQKGTSMQMSNFARQHAVQGFSRIHPDLRLYPAHQMMPELVRIPPCKMSSDSSATISSYDLANSDKNMCAGTNTEDNSGSVSKHNSFRQPNCENFKVPFAPFKTCVDQRNLERSFPQWHSDDKTLDRHQIYHQNFNSDITQSSHLSQDFSSCSTDSNCNGIQWRSDQEPVKHIADGAFSSQSVQQFYSQTQHQFEPAQNQSTSHSDMNMRFQQNVQPGIEEKFRHFLDKHNPVGPSQIKHQMPSATQSNEASEQCFGFTSSSFSAREHVAIDTVMTPEQLSDESTFQMSGKKSDEILDLTWADHSSEAKNIVGNGTAEVKKAENENETVMSSALSLDQSDNKSFENLRCSSPGSVISREGSNSSQKSQYSPAIIQILLDQVLDSNQGFLFAENLKQKLDQSKTNHTVLQRVLNLIHQASERRKSSSELPGTGDSNFGLSKLPENRSEGLNRFLNDLNDNCNEKEPPLLRKKRCIEEMNLKESFENLDVQRAVNVDVLTEIHGLNDSCNNASRSPHASMPQPDGSSHVHNSSQENSRSCYPEVPTTKISVNHSNQTGSHTISRIPTVQIASSSVKSPSQQISSNQNFHSNSQCISTNRNAQYNSQTASDNQNAQSVPIQSCSAMSDIDILQQSGLKNMEVSDNLVTSTDLVEEGEENVEEMLQIIDCMNLAMKILNRFKPEHREKIRLFKQGQLHLRIMTASDEDCAEIYEKLMQGIPGLNDRILGFCESVPGFAELSKEDKEKLVKRSYYDMWTLSYAEYFQNGESFWILPSGEIYSAQAMRKILNDEMVDTIMTFSDAYNRLEFTDLETALFSAVRLTTTAGTEMEDHAKVEQLHSRLLDTLVFEIKRNHYGNHMRLVIELFKLVPLIEAINRIQGEIIANFSVKRFQKKAADAGEGGQRSEEPVKPVEVPRQSV